MLKSKKVADLIEDTKIRIDAVKTFLDEVRGKEGENFVTPITDPFGPAITDSNLSCIVGSDETKRGCEKINEIRRYFCKILFILYQNSKALVVIYRSSYLFIFQ